MIRDIPSKDTTGYLRATIDNQTLSWDNVKEIIKQYTQIVNYHNVNVPLYSPISIDMFLFTTGVYESEADTENIEANEPDNENIEAPNDTDNNDDEEIDTFDDVSLDIGLNVDGEIVNVPIGKFVIDDLSENYQETCEITCLDYAVKMKPNIDYSPCFVEGKATIDTIFEYICTYFFFNFY